MRLQLILPRVNPAEITSAQVLSYCGGVDTLSFGKRSASHCETTAYTQVNAHRYACLKCGVT